MKINLTIFERIVCLSLLPYKEDYENIKNVREVRKQIGLSVEEIGLFKPFIHSDLIADMIGTMLVTPVSVGKSGSLSADWVEVDKVIPEKEIDFSVSEIFNDIKTKLQNRNAEKKLDENKISLYKKLVIDKKIGE